MSDLDRQRKELIAQKVEKDLIEMYGQFYPPGLKYIFTEIQMALPEETKTE